MISPVLAEDTTHGRRSVTVSPVEIRWDVFVSYARRDRERVRPLAAALLAQGLRVFVDEAAVSDFDSISRVIRTELAGSKALLAFYSTGYPTRRACQWELTVAYLAGQREGDPRRRVLVVNPEPSVDHIHPVELRDARHWPVPAAALLPTFAGSVAAHVASLSTPFGQVAALTPVRWLPAPPRLGSPGFIDRLPQLWRLHSALHPHAAALLTGLSTASAVVLRGPAGAGKTLLAEDYAVGFSAAFAGGVYWLTLNDDRDPLPAYTRQVRTICTALGIHTTESLDDALSALAVALERCGAPCLWVVDGVPEGLPLDTVRLFLAPHQIAATIMTTRGSYADLARPIDLTTAGSTVDTITGMPDRGPTEAQRMAAFDLQVELATRVGLQLLADDDGGLREALTSLHSLFQTTRTILRTHGPDADAIHDVAGALLNDILRPFLTRWHPQLAAHEERREPSMGTWAHERSWINAGALRGEIAQLREPLSDVLARLADISGTDLGLATRR